MQKSIKEITDEKELNNFSGIVGWIMKFLLSQWDIEAKPKGYDEFTKDYMDFDGMEEMDSKALWDLFEGFSNDGVGHPSFPIWTSLPHVAYDDKCQGRPPIETMIGAILNYGMYIGERRQQLKQIKMLDRLKSDLERLDLDNEKEQSFNKHIIEFAVRSLKEELEFL